MLIAATRPQMTETNQDHTIELAEMTMADEDKGTPLTQAGPNALTAPAAPQSADGDARPRGGMELDGDHRLDRESQGRRVELRAEGGHDTGRDQTPDAERAGRRRDPGPGRDLVVRQTGVLDQRGEDASIDVVELDGVVSQARCRRRAFRGCHHRRIFGHQLVLRRPCCT